MIGSKNKPHRIDEECSWHGLSTRLVIGDGMHVEIHNIRMQNTKSILESGIDEKE
jgi:hypothetical protein